MKRKNIYILAGAAIVLIIIFWYFSSSNQIAGSTILTDVKEGQFVIDVTTTGELEARSSENIMGPNTMALRDARIWQLVIEDIVPDGTVVDSGDWVATLDRSELENKIKDQELEVEKLQTQFVKTQLDTSMTLRGARDELINLKYSVEEKKITVDQSIYEPPATQRQAQMDYDKAKRSLDQAVENYSLQSQKAAADMKDVSASLTKAQRNLDELKELIKSFTIKAPKAGMVNYKKNWEGKKQGVGAQISTWENIVATLPNLSAMNSKTYVNEIDISKVKVGQKADVEVDAFPGKEFMGKVVEVANIGEQLKNSNAKVFEVIIQIDGHDSILRPSMTTKNRIITDVIDSALYIPIECIHSNDSITYVYKGSHKQQVLPGKSNESDMIILAGLEKGDRVYLHAPDDAEKWPFSYLSDNTILLAEKNDSTQKKSVVDEGPFDYYLIVGSFTEPKEAKQFVGTLRKDGNGDAGVLQRDDINRVFIKKYTSTEDANSAKEKLPEKYHEAWIYKEKAKSSDEHHGNHFKEDKGNRPGPSKNQN
jgi:HlyD family secretion protein